MAIDLKKEPTLDVFEALQTRYTCREFKPDPLSRGKVQSILEAANRAPSTANTQPWEIFAATGEPLDRLREAFMENFQKNMPPGPDLPLSHQWPKELEERRREIMALQQKRAGFHTADTTDSRQHSIHNFEFFKAPAVIYLCMDKTLGFWSIFDLGLFSQSLMLAAKAKGVDTAPAIMLVSYPDLIRDELEIPRRLSIVFGIAMGYGTEKSRPEPFPSPRRGLDQFVRWKGFKS
jgi:nitroreductase